MQEIAAERGSFGSACDTPTIESTTRSGNIFMAGLERTFDVANVAKHADNGRMSRSLALVASMGPLVLWASGCFLAAGPFEDEGSGGTGAGGDTGTSAGGTGTGTSATTGTTGGDGGAGGSGATGGAGGTGATGGAGGTGGTGGSTTTTTTGGVCGDGTKNAGEECDDGDMDDTDECVDCKNAFCGDGVLHNGVEACDDGNDTEGDGCYNCQPDCGCTGCAAGTPCMNCGPGGPQTGYIIYKSSASKHCYAFVPSSGSWGAGDSGCKGYGWELFAPSTTAELNEVTSTTLINAINANGTRCWTGGYKDGANWAWSNGEPFTYTDGAAPWQPGEPNGPDSCIVLGQNGASLTLRNNNCNEGRPYICERP